MCDLGEGMDVFATTTHTYTCIKYSSKGKQNLAFDLASLVPLGVSGQF